MKLGPYILRSSWVTGTLGCLFLCCAWQALLGQAAQANPSSVPFDGTYVPDPKWSDTSVLLGSGPQCPATNPGVLGQGLIVTNSLATFDVGVQQIGTRKIKPSKVNGKVGSDGTLTISKGMVRVNGRFDGPNVTGQQNSFKGQFIVDFDRHNSCAYSLQLTQGSPASK